ncbi:sigma-70 family RNA polymerase sigma factor [Fluviicola sp.]|uniref:RNA polymerase sigma factor n=1 Tax=Fluviicola sp. TaxID=1917219 RepID=UPI0031D10322
MELELIKRCVEEDRRSQELFYKQCYAKFIGTAYRYSNGKEQAVHFFNLGFVNILMNLKKYNPENPFDYWAKRVLINTILNELKKERREQERFFPAEDISQFSQTTWDDDDEMIREKIELIREKANLLPPMTKNVFNLYTIDGYKHHEIAALLDINENTSMWHYSDAKKKLRKMLDIN